MERCVIWNSVVYQNRAAGDQGDYNFNANFTGSVLAEFNHSCTWPMPPNGSGNVTNAPLFVDASSQDFRVQADSPVVDAGFYRDEYSAITNDLSGYRRVANDQVDVGAYEFYFEGDIRCFLDGPSLAGRMHASIEPGESSPYAVAPKVDDDIETNVVDWVLVELLNAEGNVVFSESALLRDGGRLVSTDDQGAVLLEGRRPIGWSCQTLSTRLAIFRQTSIGMESYRRMIFG